MDRITYDDIYEIAAEVAEETITKFLQNLVKLVPAAEDVVDDIKEQQYEDLKMLKQNRSNTNFDTDFSNTETSFRERQNADFAAIAGKRSMNESTDIDSALAQIPVDNSDLLGAAAASPVENNIVPQAGVANI